MRNRGFRWAAAGLLLATAVYAASYRWRLMDLNRLPAEQVFFITYDDLGGKYFATPKGFTYVDKSDNFQMFTRSSTNGGLGSDSVTCMGLDRYRQLWIGTSRGLSAYSNGQWTRYTRDSTRGGLPDDGVLSLALYKEERWIGTRNGFAMLHGNSWTTYTGDRISGRLPNHEVTAIAVDSSGRKWIGTIGGLVRFTGSAWTLYTRENTHGGLPHNGITYLVVDSSNAVWVGTQAGVARLDADGKWTNYQSEARLGGLSKEVTYSLSLGPSGEVWACLRGGSARFSNGEWELFSKGTAAGEGLPTLFIYYVLQMADGGIWFATEKGVASKLPGPREEE